MRKFPRTRDSPILLLFPTPFLSTSRSQRTCTSPRTPKHTRQRDSKRWNSTTAHVSLFVRSFVRSFGCRYLSLLRRVVLGSCAIYIYSILAPPDPNLETNHVYDCSVWRVKKLCRGGCGSWIDAVMLWWWRSSIYTCSMQLAVTQCISSSTCPQFIPFSLFSLNSFFSPFPFSFSSSLSSLLPFSLFPCLFSLFPPGRPPPPPPPPAPISF